VEYQLTIRYGKKRQRYHTFLVEAADVPLALRVAAEEIPAEIAGEADLVELRVAPDFDKVLSSDEAPEE
jgi:hypothetical protein